MEFNKLKIKASGFYVARSSYYLTHGAINDFNEYTIKKGVNVFRGDIDSEGWALSYILSMYNPNSVDFIFDRICLSIDEANVAIEEIKELSCYLDGNNKLFSSKASVKDQVKEGLKSTNAKCSAEDIRRMFYIDKERFARPIKAVGNEFYKAMAAIGYSYGKEFFCFPWFSVSLYESFHYHLSLLPNILKDLGKTVILPLGAGSADLKMDLPRDFSE